MTIKDSGERTEFSTGAVRDMHAGKGRFDLLCWNAIHDYAKHCEEGAIKYGEGNAKLGIPQHSLIDSTFRHLSKYIRGETDEPHLRAAVWNAMLALEQETTHPEMQDIPELMKIETWRQSKYENFEVSNLGRIRNKRTKNVLQGVLNSKGYVNVCLYGVGTKRLHRIVAEAFIPNPHGYSEVNHKNGDKQDNRIYNLEWCTHQQNMHHAAETGLRDGINVKVTQAQRDFINAKKRSMSYRSIGKQLGLSHTTVRRVALEQETTHPELVDVPGRETETSEQKVEHHYECDFDMADLLDLIRELANARGMTLEETLLGHENCAKHMKRIERGV